MSVAPVRNPRVLVVGGMLAIGLGWLASVVLGPKPPTHSPNEVAFRVGPTEPVDPRVVQEQAIEELVERAAVEPPRSIGGFEVARLLLGQESGSWVQQRLLEDGVPAGLRLELGRALGREGLPGERSDALLASLLDGVHGGSAVEALVSRGSLMRRSLPSCACWFGVHPAQPVPGQPMRLLAGSLRGGRAPSWSPEPTDAGWTLRLGEPSEQGLQVKTVSAPQLPWALYGRADAPPLEVGVEVTRRQPGADLVRPAVPGAKAGRGGSPADRN